MGGADQRPLCLHCLKAAHEAVLRQEHAAVGIGKVALRLGIGSFEGGRGTGPERLRFSALRFSSAARSASAFAAAAAAASASSASLASRIFATRSYLSAIQPGISSPRAR